MRPAGKLGDRVLFGLCALAGALAFVILVEIVYQVVHGAGPAISKFGLGFVSHSDWRPNFRVFGAGVSVFGTVVSSVIALVLAAPIAIGIALYLAELAPRSVRAVVGPLVEMLAAIPSVILGFWGLIVLAPFLSRHVEPWLHDTLGFLPIFGGPQSTGLSIFTAGIVLAIMVVPIVASLSRDLFLTVPAELREGAEALGATRWEVVRGVILPSSASGVAAAIVLGLGRALGETIAVAQVIGAGNAIHSSLFDTGSTLASKIALEFPNFDSKLHTQALFYLATVLLVIGVVTNLIAQLISRRFDAHRAIAL